MVHLTNSTAWGLDTGRVDWSKAACRRRPDVDVLFFGKSAEQQVAKKVCTGCPVRVDCLADAMNGEVEFGVWGGLTERERKLLRRLHPDVTDWLTFLSRQPVDLSRCGTYAGYQAHLRAYEPPCDGCLAALREYRAAYKAGARVGRPQRYRATL